MGGGSKGGSQKSTTNQSGVSMTVLPDWLTGAAQQAVGMAQNLATAPYVPYTGQVVAGVTPETQQAYQQIAALQGMQDPAFQAAAQTYQGLLPSAAPITASGLNQAASSLYGNFAGNVLAPTAGLLGGFTANAAPATAQQVAANTQQLMSPYAQQVIAPTLQAGQQQLALANQQIAQQAANVGAFGGSRQGVEQGVAEAQTALGTQQQVANLLNQGYGQALQAGTGLATTAAGQGLTAAQTLAQQALQGYTGYGQAAQGAGQLAQQNLAAGLQAAQYLPQQALTAAQLAQQQAGAMQVVGTAEQQQQQALLNAQQQQFYQQQAWPYQGLETLLSGVSGVPYGSTTYTQGTGGGQQMTQPGMLNQVTGALGGLGSLAGGIGTLANSGVGTWLGSAATSLLGFL